MKTGDGRWAELPWVSWGAAALTAFGLKLHYSRASVEELGWILRPTALAVGRLRGEVLALLPGAGWAPPDGEYVIAPACAGVNFLILALAVSAFGFAHRLRSGRARLAGWLGSLAGAWLLTVLVNALRIVAAVELYRRGPVAGLSPEEAHRLLGVAVYLGALWALFAFLDHCTAGTVSGAPRSAWRAALVPALYLGMTVALPFLHGGAEVENGRRAGHAMIVTLATLLISGLVVLPGLARRVRRAS